MPIDTGDPDAAPDYDSHTASPIHHLQRKEARQRYTRPEGNKSLLEKGSWDVERRIVLISRPSRQILHEPNVYL